MSSSSSSSPSSPNTPLLKKRTKKTSSTSSSCDKDDFKEFKRLKTELHRLDQRLDDLRCQNDSEFDSEFNSVEDINFDDINDDNKRMLDNIRSNIEKIERDMDDFYKQKKAT